MIYFVFLPFQVQAAGITPATPQARVNVSYHVLPASVEHSIRVFVQNQPLFVNGESVTCGKVETDATPGDDNDVASAIWTVCGLILAGMHLIGSSELSAASNKE